MPLFDQRGNNFGRVQNGRIDIGALEVRDTLFADFDGDGFISGFDFLLWQRGLATIAPQAEKSDGDADNDLDVDASDLGVWEQQYGTAPPLVATASFSPTEPLTKPRPAGVELADVALAVVQADGVSRNRKFVAHSPPREFFTAGPMRRSDFASGSLISSSATTSTPRDDEGQSPEESTAWEDAVDNLFDAVFQAWALSDNRRH